MVRTKQEWQRFAERRLNKIISVAQGFSSLKKVQPQNAWKINVQLIGSKKMIEMNHAYRRKDYATDVLSFPTVAVFCQMGFLGDLVICLPTLRRQAKALGHSPEMEMEVLLVHGLLHLLGFDHEAGGKEAKTMAHWEARILEKSLPRSVFRKGAKGIGLIDRTKSGNKIKI